MSILFYKNRPPLTVALRAKYARLDVNLVHMNLSIVDKDSGETLGSVTLYESETAELIASLKKERRLAMARIRRRNAKLRAKIRSAINECVGNKRKACKTWHYPGSSWSRDMAISRELTCYSAKLPLYPSADFFMASQPCYVTNVVDNCQDKCYDARYACQNL